MRLRGRELRTSSRSRGARALALILDQSSWTHRRVESLMFLANGETRRRVSWDFTVPNEWAISVAPDRVAVPMATLRKEPLKRLDVRDARGAALPVWGTQDNGALAVELLRAGLEGVRGQGLPPTLVGAVQRVVFAKSAEAAKADVQLLINDLPRTDQVASDLVEAVESLVYTLAESFLFVIEVPATSVGARTIVKASYEDERAKGPGGPVSFRGRQEVAIEANGWAYAASWHLEVRAPEGLHVDELRFEAWDPVSGSLTSEDRDADGGGTAHITAVGLSPYDEFSCLVRFAPDRSALLNQLMLGAALAAVLLWTSTILAVQIADRLARTGGASFGAVVFSLPALFFAFLTRGAEHELTSKVLLGPRLASLGSALTLWAAGVSIVWRPEAGDLQATLLVLSVMQSALFCWLSTMRSVGGRV